MPRDAARPIYPASTWPLDGGSLDRLDKSISSPFFRLQIGALAEALLSVPGCCFGAPAFLSILPSALGCALQADHCAGAPAGARACLGITTIIILGAWARLVSQPPAKADEAATKRQRGDAKGVGLATMQGLAKLLYHPALVLLAPLAGTALLARLADAEGRAAGSFFLLGWFVAISPVIELKKWAHRRRPLASDARHLGERAAAALPRKAIQNIPTMIRSFDSNASFPSGDVAGAVAFAYPLVRCGSPSLGLACLLLSVLGRLYWHAHHALDVLVGGTLSLTVVLGLERALSACAASPDHAAYCAGLGGAAPGGFPGAALWHPALGFLLLVGLRVIFPPKHGAGYTGSKTND